jgi:hypothetical protein
LIVEGSLLDMLLHLRMPALKASNSGEEAEEAEEDEGAIPRPREPLNGLRLLRKEVAEERISKPERG